MALGIELPQLDYGTRPSGELATLVDVSRWRAETYGDELAFTWLADGETPDGSLTFGDLDRRARAIAVELQACRAEGQRVLLMQEPGLDYVASLWGCFYAAAIAVPVYPPDPFRLQRTLPRLQAIVHNAGAQLMLSSRKVLGEKTGALWTLCGGDAIPVEEIPLEQRCAWRQHSASPHDVALLQYTSGSTGTPRGVALTHANLMHNVRAMCEIWDVEDAVALHWLPPYHDMGLIGGILLPFYAGRRTILLSPLAFMQRPIGWLRAIDRFRATTTGSPNFGYELCVRKIKPEECEGLDLSCWRVAVTGAEPIRASTIDRFAEKFEPFGFRRSAFAPAFGMAEATVIVTGKESSAAPTVRAYCGRALQQNRAERTARQDDARLLVGCGPAAPEVEVAIVDPNRRTRLAPGRIGEIWVRSPGVATGYWGLRDETAQVFNARIAGENHGGYLRTGDLGFLDQGQLFVTGRQKELIILAGRNYYPHDIETSVQESHAALKTDSGAAFSIDCDGEERLVIVQEVLRPKRCDLDELIRCARRAVAEQFELTPHAVVLAPCGSLPKTSSGKLRRSACRDLFLKGQLPTLICWTLGSAESSAPPPDSRQDPPQTKMERQLAEIWREVLGLDCVGREANFFELGGQSLRVIQLLGRVWDLLRIQAPLALLFDHPTLKQFAEALENLQDDREPGGAILGVEPIRMASEESGQDNETYPLSYSQQRFWFLESFGQRGAFLHVPVSIRLAGDLDTAKLSRALERLVERHEALRTGFFERDGEPFQRMTDCRQVPLTTVDLSGKTSDEGQEQRRALEAEFVRRPFDLQSPPLMRAMLARLSQREHVLTIVLHHIVCDGWSLELLLRDLARLYDGADGAALAPPSVRYVDYARWERRTANGQQWQGSLAYWKERLADAPRVLELPVDGRRRADPPQDAGVCRRPLSAPLRGAIEAHARACNATPFMAHLAAYQVLLSRYARTNDLCVGVPVANRGRTDLENLVGCFMNTAVLRADLSGDPTFGQLLLRTRNSVLRDLEHAGVPFEKIVEALQPERQPGRMPLVQAVFIFQSPASPPTAMGAARIVQIESDYSALAAFDLTLVIEPQGSDLSATLVYNRELFEEEAMERMLDAYLAILGQIGAAPATPLSRLPVPAEPERRRMLVEWNATDRQPPPAECAQDAIAVQVERTPDAVALQWRDGQLTFGQLDRRANRLAHYLKDRGVGPDTLVGIHLQRSPEMVIALVAVWKAGGAYVPLDPSYPRKRLEAILDDCSPPLVLTEQQLEARLPAAPATEIATWESIRPCLENRPETAPDSSAARNNLAYVMYTSGSTGAPKGVMVEQGAVVNLLASFAKRPGLLPSDRMLAVTTISFDISVLELFLPLSVGARAVISHCSVAADPDAVRDLIAQKQVNVLQATPSAYRLLLLSGWKPARGMKVLCGGEPLTADLAEQLIGDEGELWNVYGPTETTVWSTAHRVTGCNGVVPIGGPIDNTQVYVLDDSGSPAPAGVPGELYIGGCGVSRGYWGRPDWSAERFVADPFRNGRSGRLYRTGDLVRWRSDGVLEFLSRLDDQVKVRGFRVELGEIEAAICQHEDVLEAAVTVARRDGADQMLAAHYTTADGRTVRPEQLREYLAEHLPDYMIPACFTQSARLPRTPAGKIDRLALPTPAEASRAATEQFVPPRSPLEQEIARLWRDVLGLERVGVNDNFFQLGGHSLIAAQLFARLRKSLKIDLPLRQLYERPTVGALAEWIVSVQLQHGDRQRLASLFDRVESMSEEKALETLGAADPQLGRRD